MQNSIFTKGASGANLVKGSGTFTSQGYNLSNDSGSGLLTGTGDLINTDPLLGPLQDNGGSTFTHALLAGSPAINAGDTTLTTDQRGIARPQVNRDDIGAFELVFTPNESLVVTTTVDEDNGTSDASFGSGTSLREAIGYANVKPNADASTLDEITFNIPDAQKSSGIWTIQLASALPAISDDVTISGPGARLLTVRGGGASFDILTLNNNLSASFSGLTLNNGNNGLYNSGTATVTGCTLSGNTNGLANAGTANVTNSTLSGNGKGIYNVSVLTLVNSTLSGNADGIYSQGGVTLINSTLSGNTSSGLSNNGGAATVQNSLVVGNPTNVSGAFTDGGNNITSGTAADAGLDPAGLKDNGGPTKTMALLAGSPAINAGSNALLPGGITTDGRGAGFPRTIGGTVDIGAFESSILPPPPTLAITSPVHNSTLATAPTTASGTASGASSVSCYGFYRYNTGANTPGWWTGKGNTFTATNTIGTLAATNTGTSFSTWSLNLPSLIPGRYVLYMRATNAIGTRVNKYSIFTINDASSLPSVAITNPSNGSSFTTTALPAVTGIASDGDGIAGVTVRLYRSATGGNTAGYWNGTAFVTPYDPATQEIAATNTGTAFSTWSYALPVLGQGKYSLVATAKDTLGNYKAVGVGFTVDVVAPTLDITSPVHNSTLATAPTTASGTASAASSVSCYGLYRYNTGANTPGYWTGTGNTFTATNTIGTLAATNTGTSFSTWSLNLPSLIPGRYVLFMRVTSAVDTRVNQYSIFTVNDASPVVAITNPTSGGSYNAGSGAGSLSSADGTASDGGGIASVTVRLYRKATRGNTAGYWNGNVASPGYTSRYSVANEMVATTSDAYAHWSVALPALGLGDYSLVATAKDNLGNYSAVSSGVTAQSLAERSVTARGAKNSVSFTIVAAHSTEASSPSTQSSTLSSIEAVTSASAVVLQFTGSVPSGAFSVSANGQVVTSQSQGAVQQGAGQSVRLLLPDNTLQAGDKVSVTWNGGSATAIAE